MSAHNEEIARLTGSLIFDVKTGPLLAFEQMLKRVQASMAGMMKTADDLNKRLDRKLGISTKRDASAAANTAAQRSLDKQVATEAKLSRLRQSQFRAALAEQKLTSAGNREAAFLQSASLKQQVTAAVLSAKQRKAEQEALKVDLGRAKVQASAEQSKIREARLADILQRRQERTVQLQQQAALHQSKLQRAEASLVAARERGIRLAERHQASKLVSAAREARAAVRGEQTAGRYSMAQERFAAWKARQDSPESSGIGGFTVGLGAAGAALYALTEAAGYLGKRIEQRQETAADNQQFDNTLLAAGNNDKERARIKAAYIGNSQEYGMKIDRESAVAYSNMIQGFRAQGKTLEEAIQLQKDQAAVFRIGNLDKTQQYSAALQLNQGYSKDRFMGQDLRPLTDALGTRLTTILYQAIGKALGYKGDVNKLAGFVLEAQHDGKVNGAMVQQGLRDIVAQSPELLERHKRSLDAQAVRVENDQYLRSVGVNESPELIAALGDRLTAERQLIESTTGLKAAFRDVDIVLVKLQTSMLNLLAGKNADNSEKTPQQRAEEVGAGFLIEGSGIDPFAINGKSGGSRTAQGQLDEEARDPVSKLWRLLGVGNDLQKVADDNRQRWGQVGFSDHAPLDPRLPALDTSGLNTRALPDFGKHLEDLLSQSDPNNAVAKVAAQAVATASRATPGSRGEMVSDDQSAKGGTTINNQTTVNAPPVEITVNVKTDANATEIATAVSGQVREEMQKTFQAYLPKETM
ncbi:hypothetical protein HX819_27735 [Pseudomonas sp. D6002]|uniref:hypothetical protein n=1 Tax=unclassified Pseudomonas TaxID=196821 RepID=UPI0015A3E9E7|nr:MULTISPECIES: hypothetical protein [unclassified Pseudomonas]NVZ95110.1 hypothetical protein [Pseudomonas sp. B6001]NWB18243.1 hypothetical protein [Pseudomonas sp. D6002]